jgi:REP element-mobilizing transposase RayT
LSHTYFQNALHIVFSTKERRKIIPTQMKERLWAYTAGICQHQNIFVHAIGGMEDHIHLLLQFPATIAIADAINKIKTIRRVGCPERLAGSHGNRGMAGSG